MKIERRGVITRTDNGYQKNTGNCGFPFYQFFIRKVMLHAISLWQKYMDKPSGQIQAL